MTDLETNQPDKAQLATENYINNCVIEGKESYTWAQAMRDAGYAESTIDKNSAMVWGYVGVQEQIKAAKEQKKADAVFTLEKATQNNTRLMRRAEKAEQFSAAVTANVANARLYGMDKDNQLHTDKPVDIDETDLALVEEMARQKLKLA